MRLIWNIIRKDLVRDRWALLLWALLFIGQMGFGLTLFHELGNDRDRIKHLELVNAGFVFAQFALGYVLVARLVQADRTVGTDVFWATRPIGRGRLLLAKAGAALLVFGALPVLLLAPWWLWCNFNGLSLCWAAVEAFGWQLLMIAPAFLVASLTDNFGRVMLWSVLLFMSLLMGIGGLMSTFKLNFAENTGVAYTRIWLACVLFVLVSGGVVLHQYLTRRLNRSISLTVAAGGLVVLAALFAPWNWADRLATLGRSEVVPEVVAALPGLKIEVWGGDQNDRTPKPGEERMITTEVYFQGLAPHLGIMADRGRQSWKWPDGVVINRALNFGSGDLDTGLFLRETWALPKLVEDPETQAWHKNWQRKETDARRKSGLPPISRVHAVPPQRPGLRGWLYSQAPKALGARMLSDPPAYEASLQGAVTHPVILAELPLKAGACTSRDSMSARVVWTGPQTMVREGKHWDTLSGLPEGMTVALLTTEPQWRRGGLWFVSRIIADFPSYLPDDLYTVNRSNGEIRLAKGYNSSNWSPTRMMLAGVVLQWNGVTVLPDHVRRGDRWVVRDSQWAEHTTLALVAERIAARFSATVQTDRLEFRPRRMVKSE